MNHEQLIAELAKSMSRIASALPRVDVHLHLYPTEAMKCAVEDLYALLISFYQRALRWYEARPIKRAIRTIIKPYPLQFQDIVEGIQNRVREVESQAIAMAHKEIREVYVLVKECCTAQNMMRAEQSAVHSERGQLASTMHGIEESKLQTNARLRDLEQLLTCKKHLTEASCDSFLTRQ